MNSWYSSWRDKNLDLPLPRIAYVLPYPLSSWYFPDSLSSWYLPDPWVRVKSCAAGRKARVLPYVFSSWNFPDWWVGDLLLRLPASRVCVCVGVCVCVCVCVCICWLLESQHTVHVVAYSLGSCVAVCCSVLQCIAVYHSVLGSWYCRDLTCWVRDMLTNELVICSCVCLHASNRDTRRNSILSLCLRTHLFMDMCKYMYVCIYICMCIYMYV